MKKWSFCIIITLVYCLLLLLSYHSPQFQPLSLPWQPSHPIASPPLARRACPKADPSPSSLISPLTASCSSRGVGHKKLPMPTHTRSRAPFFCYHLFMRALFFQCACNVQEMSKTTNTGRLTIRRFGSFTMEINMELIFCTNIIYLLITFFHQ